MAGALLVQSSVAKAQGPYELEWDEEWIWLGAGASLTVAGVVGALALPPFTLEAPPTADGINRLDRSLMQPYREDHLGDVLLLSSCAFPLGLFLRSDVRENGDAVGLAWVESALLTEGLFFATKGIVRRPRPYVYDADAPERLRTGRDSRLSFYSGHASFTAMNCVYTATVFSDFSDDHDAEIAMWAGAVVYTATTAITRVRSGHHFATDVIVGVATGAAIGYLVPALHRTDAPGGTTASTAHAPPLTFSLTFAF